MKEKVEIALVQMDVAWLDPEENRRKMVRFVDQIASQKPVDLVVFPELANTGYVKERGDVKIKDFGREYIKRAESIPGPTTEALCACAKRYKIHIISGLCQVHPNIPATLYNSAVLIDSSGEILGVHHKVHIAVQGKHYFYPGNTVEVYDTRLGNIGMMVCYDGYFPELTRILSLKGAEIICAVWAGQKRKPLDRLEHLASTRAYENRNYFVLCNRVGVEGEKIHAGHSTVAGPDGQIISASGNEEEGIVYATLLGDRILEERAYFPVFRDRRPELYEILSRPL